MIGQERMSRQQGQERRLRRFAALSALGPFDGRSVLELGCGSGDFYRFLISRGQRPFYLGVDASLESVAEARARFGGDEACRFVHDDIEGFQPATPFDYVIASAPPRETGPAGGAALAEALTRVFSWCTRGAAACFPSARAPGRAPHPARVDPAAAVKAALRLTPAVRLMHDYLPADFAVFLYRSPAWDAAAGNEPLKGAS